MTDRTETADTEGMSAEIDYAAISDAVVSELIGICVRAVLYSRPDVVVGCPRRDPAGFGQQITVAVDGDLYRVLVEEVEGP